MITAVHHIPTGRLVDIQSTQAALEPLNPLRQANGAVELGGLPSEYQVVELPPELFATLVPGAEVTGNVDDVTKVVNFITQTTPPVLDVQIVGNQATVTVTLTGNYSGEVYWRAVSPTGATYTATQTAASGVDSLTIALIEGEYAVTVRVPGHGVASAFFSGV